MRRLPPGAGHHRAERGPLGPRRHRGAVRELPPDPGPYARIGAVGAMARRRFIVEADGGSRGNPGPAGYGAVVLDAVTGEPLAEVAEYIGTATNNVAEYKGLIAGLRAAHALDPEAEVQGPDGLQAGHRADVRPLEDQAPGTCGRSPP
ncbi:Ribonuclease HI, partial [Streptomyces himastatinicus ATCC 53653]